MDLCYLCMKSVIWRRPKCEHQTIGKISMILATISVQILHFELSVEHWHIKSYDLGGLLTYELLEIMRPQTVAPYSSNQKLSALIHSNWGPRSKLLCLNNILQKIMVQWHHQSIKPHQTVTFCEWWSFSEPQNVLITDLRHQKRARWPKISILFQASNWQKHAVVDGLLHFSEDIIPTIRISEVPISHVKDAILKSKTKPPVSLSLCNLLLYNTYPFHCFHNDLQSGMVSSYQFLIIKC